MNRYRWEVAPQVPPDHLRRFVDLDPLVVQILYNRGFVRPEEVRAFLAYETEDDNPFRLHGMNQAVSRIRNAIRRREPIAIYGDFDVDGVTSTALLVQVLRALGAQVEPYIPHRVTEGYGLNRGALKELADRGVKLVITVDCGIRAVDEVCYGRRLGLDLIVTDHHLPPEVLPPAVALIDPHLPGCRYPFKELPGVGLAYKLAQALLRVERQVPLGTARASVKEESLLDLVALGIVADLAVLTGENRALVRRGLEVLNDTQRVGLRALMEVAGIRPGRIGTEAIGYILGPRLNAAGRMDHAILAYRLLVTEDPVEARQLAEQLNVRNRERQEMTQWVLDQVLDQLEGSEDEPFLIAWGEGFPPGVVGLVASRLTEQFYRPALVLELGPEVAHGSARSIPEFNIVRALDQVRDLLMKYGGHAMAAGLTVARDRVEVLRERLLEIAARELADVELVPLLSIDAEWPLERLSPQTFQRLCQLEPFGVGNPEPLLLSRNVRLRDYAAVGEDEAHLRLKLEARVETPTGKLPVVWDAMAFHQGYWAAAMPERVDIVYTPKIDVWNDQERLRLEVRDLRPSEVSHQLPDDD